MVILDGDFNGGEYIDDSRTQDEIVDMADESCKKIWFDRRLSLQYMGENGLTTVNPEIWAGVIESAQRVIAKYGEENLGPYSDFEWGLLNVKLSALKRVMRGEWDMVGTQTKYRVSNPRKISVLSRWSISRI